MEEFDHKYIDGSTLRRNGILISDREWSICQYPNGKYRLDVISSGGWFDYKDLTINELHEKLDYWDIPRSVLETDKWVVVK